MRIVFGLVLILGLGLAGFAVYMAQGYIQGYESRLAEERAQRAAQIPLTEIYVVTGTKRYGERLTKDDVRKVLWPEQGVPEGAFKSEEELFPRGFDTPRSVMRTMVKDEPVLAEKVTNAGQDAGVAARLAAGTRAFTIRVDASTGVSGFLRPGDKIDVYWTGNGGSGDITKLIQPAMRIVAIDQSADEDRTSPIVARTVTVQATPEEVAALAQAQATGRLSLSLVGAEDTTVAGAVEINQGELLGIEKTVVEAAEVCTIKTRRGAEVVEIPIDCPAN